MSEFSDTNRCFSCLLRLCESPAQICSQFFIGLISSRLASFSYCRKSEMPKYVRTDKGTGQIEGDAGIRVTKLALRDLR